MAELKTISLGSVSAQNSNYVAGTGITITADAQDATIKTIAADLANYYTKTETDNLLDGKQDTLTAGQNISIAQDGTISATDTTYNPATTSTDGLMSSADKTKLDGITWTKAGILSALGYEEVTLELTDANGNSVTKTILAAVE